MSQVKEGRRHSSGTGRHGAYGAVEHRRALHGPNAAVTAVAWGSAAALFVGALVGVAQVSQAAATDIRVDAGATKASLANDGSTYSADTGFVGGRVSGTTSAVSGALDSAITRTVRVGMKAYHLAVPPGTYKVTLVMAETYWSAAGKRVFSAAAEGVPVFSKLDLFASAGKNKEIDRSATVKVSDGTLDVTFSASVDKAIVSALRVVPTTAVATPVASTPAPAPAPVPSASTPAPVTVPLPSGPLAFSPPALVDPITMAFPSGSASVKLDVTRDYILTLPTSGALVNTKGLSITGGHNVVIIGGTVDVRDGDASTGARRAAYLSSATPNGTVYIEGVRFLSSTQGSLTEGIDIASPGARVVLQNIALDGHLSGSYTTNHADAIQAWAGPAELDVDGFSATTEYQGLFLLPNQHSSAPVRDWDLRHISLVGNDSGYLLWRDGNAAGYSIRTSHVYVSGSHIANGGLWPNASAWPSVTESAAPAAYGASAGAGYATPGYA